jgi:hypothetical protein
MTHITVTEPEDRSAVTRPEHLTDDEFLGGIAAPPSLAPEGRDAATSSWSAEDRLEQIARVRRVRFGLKVAHGPFPLRPCLSQPVK